jgi:hypothetical protein
MKNNFERFIKKIEINFLIWYYLQKTIMSCALISELKEALTFLPLITIIKILKSGINKIISLPIYRVTKN